MEEKQTKFETHAIVELFGHNQIAGKVTEQTISGQSFFRIDVPATNGWRKGLRRSPSMITGITSYEEI